MKKRKIINIDVSTMSFREANKLISGLYEANRILKAQGLGISIKKIKPKTPKA